MVFPILEPGVLFTIAAGAVKALFLPLSPELHFLMAFGAAGVGYDADLVVLDRDYEVVQTYCKGIGQK